MNLSFLTTKANEALTGVAQWAGVVPQSEGPPVWFLFGAQAWVAGLVSGSGRARGNQSLFLSHVGVSFPFFFPPFPFL